MLKFPAWLFLFCMFFACSPAQNISTDNGNQGGQQSQIANNNSANDSSDEEDEYNPQTAKVAEVYRIQCGCRDLYQRILDEGGYSSEAIKSHVQTATESVKYSLIMKNPTPFYGKPVIFTGRIIQIREVEVLDGTLTTALVQVGRSWNDLITASLPAKTPFLKGDRIAVVGYLANHLYNYKSVSQWDMSVPIIIPRAMLKPSEAARMRSQK